MTLPDDVNLPALILLGGIGIILLLWLLGSGRSRSNPRQSAQLIAAVQAERDVLRANHAVDIATLEARLDEAQKRAQGELGAALKLKEAERANGVLAAERESLNRDLAAARERLQAIGEDLETQRGEAGQVPKVVHERDQAREEVRRQSDTISELRAELQETVNKLSKATAERENTGDLVNRLTREREEGIQDLQRQVEINQDLRRDVKTLGTRLQEENGAHANVQSLSSELEALRTRAESLSRTVRAREETIHELRNAVSRLEAGTSTGAASQEQASALRIAQEREQSANEALSRLAYDRDGLQNRLTAAERQEREARAEVEKREALMELRLQKINELERRLRDQHGQIHAAMRRAEAAEEIVASGGAMDGDAPAVIVDTAAERRAEALAAELADAQTARKALVHEMEVLREQVGAQGDPRAQKALAGAKVEIDELKAEVSRLRAAPPVSTIDPDEIAALKSTIRNLADRFVRNAEGILDVEPEEMSLAEKIRAFKAARDARTRRPLRIAELKKPGSAGK
ncbi:hypothetical protein RDV64_10325 [Acuticoccus sp. MNP-M23]|uniref:hypothetical protein n=1 Tax=Acuticoccus sp. MNP-M23 TaxID=3072793 RepID=UPI00281528C0|nr:hypothetical protein [Acuticoccus sp. MNP-M23]WMS44743.1 hypothetical protein RDV64_10325 [Acuticoccus sp. MNP-M23]